MKPSVLVGLVAVGLAALLIALSTTLGPEPKASDRGSSVTPGPVAPLADPDRPAAPLAGSGAGQPQPVDVVDVAATRAAEAADGEQYANTLVVSVVDGNGKGVAGAALRLIHRPQPTGGGLAALLSATGQGDDLGDSRRGSTGPGGRHAFRSLAPEGTYAVIAEHADFAQGNVGGVRVGPSGDHEVTVKLDEGFRLTGVVRDQDGEPIHGARVRLLTQLQQAALAGSTSSVQSITTDSKGAYELGAIPPGRFALLVSARDFATQTLPQIHFDPRGKRALEHDVVLPPARALAGVVVGDDGEGIAGANVDVFGPRGGLPSRSTATTDAQGRFRVADLQGGGYDLQVQAVGFRRGAAVDVAAGTDDVRVTLQALAGVRGRVVAAAGESPATFRVSVKRVQGSAFASTGLAKDVEDAEGAFEIEGLAPGEYVVEGRADGFAPTLSAPFTITDGGPTPEVLVELTRGGTVRGRAVDKLTGEPVAGATVASYQTGHVETALHAMFAGSHDGGGGATRRKAVTDEEGYFELAGLRPETYQIEIRSPAHCERVLAGRMILEGVEDDLGAVQLSRGATLRGTVLGSDKKPSPGAKVQLMSVGGTALPGQSAQIYEGRCNAEGTFTLSRILPGRYKLTAARASDNPFDAIIDTAHSEVEIMVADNSDMTHDLLLGE